MSPADPLKTVKLQIRLTPLEREYLQALAAQKQMSLSEYLRWLIHREAQKLQ